MEATCTAGKTLILKDSAASGGVKLKRVVTKAKFEAVKAVDGRDGLIRMSGKVGDHGFSFDVDVSLEATLLSLDKITASTNAVTSLLRLKVEPTYIVVGDVKTLSYADE